jgi:hypothetical protein
MEANKKRSCSASEPVNPIESAGTMNTGPVGGDKTGNRSIHDPNQCGIFFVK